MFREVVDVVGDNHQVSDLKSRVRAATGIGNEQRLEMCIRDSVNVHLIGSEQFDTSGNFGQVKITVFGDKLPTAAF